MISKFLFLFFLVSCADVTPGGSRVALIDMSGTLLDFQNKANKIKHHYGCEDRGFIDSNTSLFPGSYSLNENEVHAALRNRAAKVHANLVIADFSQKPATGVGLYCPPDVIKNFPDDD